MITNTESHKDPNLEAFDNLKARMRILDIMHDSSTNGICLLDIGSKSSISYNDNIYRVRFDLERGNSISIIEPNSSLEHILRRSGIDLISLYRTIIEPLLKEVDVTWPRVAVEQTENGDYLEVHIDQVPSEGLYRVRVTDVTRKYLMQEEIKFRKEFLESIFEAISYTDSIMILDSNWNIIDATIAKQFSSRYEAPRGVNLRDIPNINQVYFQRQPNDTEENFQKRLNAIEIALETGLPLNITYEYEVEDPIDKTKIPQSRLLTFTPIKSTLDTPTPQILLFSKNTSELLNAQREIVDLRNLVDSAQDFREFVSGTVHNIMNSLASIIMRTQMIDMNLEHIPDEKIHSYLRSVVDSAKKISNIREEILIAAINGSKLNNFAAVELDIVEVLDSMAKTFSQKMERNIDFRISTIDNYKVLNDPFHVSIVIENLLSNACKYSQGDIIVLLNKDNNGTTIEVIDEGIGISQEDIDKIMLTQFYRGSNVGNIGGTGIGLDLIKKSIKMMNGKLKIYSELGAGSRFVVELG